AALRPFPTRRSSDLQAGVREHAGQDQTGAEDDQKCAERSSHTAQLQVDGSADVRCCRPGPPARHEAPLQATEAPSPASGEGASLRRATSGPASTRLQASTWISRTP